MERITQRHLGRRALLRNAAISTGALGLGLSRAGQFVPSAWAQESTPAAAEFDAAACYQPFAGAETVQYEKLACRTHTSATSGARR